MNISAHGGTGKCTTRSWSTTAVHFSVFPVTSPPTGRRGRGRLRRCRRLQRSTTRSITKWSGWARARRFSVSTVATDFTTTEATSRSRSADPFRRTVRGVSSAPTTNAHTGAFDRPDPVSLGVALVTSPGSHQRRPLGPRPTRPSPTAASRTTNSRQRLDLTRSVTLVRFRPHGTTVDNCTAHYSTASIGDISVSPVFTHPQNSTWELATFASKLNHGLQTPVLDVPYAGYGHTALTTRRLAMADHQLFSVFPVTTPKWGSTNSAATTTYVAETNVHFGVRGVTSTPAPGARPRRHPTEAKTTSEFRHRRPRHLPVSDVTSRGLRSSPVGA